MKNITEKYFGIVQGPLDPNKLKSCSYWFRREIRVEQNLDGMYIRHVVDEIRIYKNLVHRLLISDERLIMSL